MVKPVPQPMKQLCLAGTRSIHGTIEIGQVRVTTIMKLSDHIVENQESNFEKKPR
jgi:hypothetical protein